MASLCRTVVKGFDLFDRALASWKPGTHHEIKKIQCIQNVFL